MPVSYPNKKPAVQTKKPKKYARKAPSLVPFSRAMMLDAFLRFTKLAACTTDNNSENGQD